MSTDIEPNPFLKHIVAQVSREHSKNRCAFRVGNRIEVLHGFVGATDSRGNRMAAGERIDFERALTTMSEVEPDVPVGLP